MWQMEFVLRDCVQLLVDKKILGEYSNQYIGEDQNP